MTHVSGQSQTACQNKRRHLTVLNKPHRFRKEKSHAGKQSQYSRIDQNRNPLVMGIGQAASSKRIRHHLNCGASFFIYSVCKAVRPQSNQFFPESLIFKHS